MQISNPPVLSDTAFSGCKFCKSLMVHYSAGYSLCLCAFLICATQGFFFFFSSAVTVAKPGVMLIEIRNFCAVYHEQCFLFDSFTQEMSAFSFPVEKNTQIYDIHFLCSVSL